MQTINLSDSLEQIQGKYLDAVTRWFSTKWTKKSCVNRRRKFTTNFPCEAVFLLLFLCSSRVQYLNDLWFAPRDRDALCTRTSVSFVCAAAGCCCLIYTTHVCTVRHTIDVRPSGNISFANFQLVWMSCKRASVMGTYCVSHCHFVLRLSTLCSTIRWRNTTSRRSITSNKI